MAGKDGDFMTELRSALQKFSHLNPDDKNPDATPPRPFDPATRPRGVSRRYPSSASNRSSVSAAGSSLSPRGLGPRAGSRQLYRAAGVERSQSMYVGRGPQNAAPRVVLRKTQPNNEPLWKSRDKSEGNKTVDLREKSYMDNSQSSELNDPKPSNSMPEHPLLGVHTMTDGLRGAISRTRALPRTNRHSMPARGRLTDLAVGGKSVEHSLPGSGKEVRHSMPPSSHPPNHNNDSKVVDVPRSEETKEDWYEELNVVLRRRKEQASTVNIEEIETMKTGKSVMYFGGSRPTSLRTGPSRPPRVGGRNSLVYQSKPDSVPSSSVSPERKSSLMTPARSLGSLTSPTRKWSRRPRSPETNRSSNNSHIAQSYLDSLNEQSPRNSNDGVIETTPLRQQANDTAALDTNLHVDGYVATISPIGARKLPYVTRTNSRMFRHSDVQRNSAHSDVTTDLDTSFSKSPPIITHDSVDSNVNHRSDETNDCTPNHGNDHVLLVASRIEQLTKANKNKPMTNNGAAYTKSAISPALNESSRSKFANGGVDVFEGNTLREVMSSRKTSSIESSSRRPSSGESSRITESLIESSLSSEQFSDGGLDSVCTPPVAPPLPESTSLSSIAGHHSSTVLETKHTPKSSVSSGGGFKMLQGDEFCSEIHKAAERLRKSRESLHQEEKEDEVISDKSLGESDTREVEQEPSIQESSDSEDDNQPVYPKDTFVMDTIVLDTVTKDTTPTGSIRSPQVPLKSALRRSVSVSSDLLSYRSKRSDPDTNSLKRLPRIQFASDESLDSVSDLAADDSLSDVAHPGDLVHCLVQDVQARVHDSETDRGALSTSSTIRTRESSITGLMPSSDTSSGISDLVAEATGYTSSSVGDEDARAALSPDSMRTHSTLTSDVSYFADHSRRSLQDVNQSDGNTLTDDGFATYPPPKSVRNKSNVSGPDQEVINSLMIQQSGDRIPGDGAESEMAAGGNLGYHSHPNVTIPEPTSFHQHGNDVGRHFLENNDSDRVQTHHTPSMTEESGALDYAKFEYLLPAGSKHPLPQRVSLDKEAQKYLLYYTWSASLAKNSSKHLRRIKRDRAEEDSDSSGVFTVDQLLNSHLARRNSAGHRRSSRKPAAEVVDGGTFCRNSSRTKSLGHLSVGGVAQSSTSALSNWSPSSRSDGLCDGMTCMEKSTTLLREDGDEETIKVVEDLDEHWVRAVSNMDPPAAAPPNADWLDTDIPPPTPKTKHKLPGSEADTESLYQDYNAYEESLIRYVKREDLCRANESIKSLYRAQLDGSHALTFLDTPSTFLHRLTCCFICQSQRSSLSGPTNEPSSINTKDTASERRRKVVRKVSSAVRLPRKVKINHKRQREIYHQVDIEDKDDEDEGTPITQTIMDAGSAAAFGDGLKFAHQDQASEFYVDTQGRQGNLDVQVDGPNSIAKVNIKPDVSGKYLVTYVPVEVGVYNVNIRWNGRPIEGSPYTPRVVDARRVTPVGGWEAILDQQDRMSLKVNQRNRIEFDTRQAGPGEMRAEVKGPEGQIPVDVEGGNGTYSINFIPRVPGDYYVKVYWGEIALSRCPIYAVAGAEAALSHDKVVLTGHGLVEGRVNAEAEFVVDGSEAGPGSPEVRLTGVKDHIDVRVVPLGGNKYKAVYVPTAPGAYLLSIMWSDRQVRGSPFKVNVLASSDASKVAVSGDGIRGGVFGKEIKAVIDTRRAGPGELTAHCMGPQKVAYCELYDHRDGTFTLNIKPQESGKHLLQVKYGGEHVPGSPFTLRVAGAPDASKVRVSGPGVEAGILATYQSRFITETRGAGAGQLTVRIRGPKGAFRVEMSRESQKDRTILCRYDPTEVGDYIISVKWSGDHVPGSPFHVNILDTNEELERFLMENPQRRQNLPIAGPDRHWSEDL